MTITTITMTGDPAADIAAIQTAWATVGGMIDIAGDLNAPLLPLVLAEPGGAGNQTGQTSLNGGGYMHCNGIYPSGRNWAIRGIEYSNPTGPGIVCSNILNGYVEDNYIASYSEGLSLGTVAAGRVHGNQFNGLKDGAGNYGGHGIFIGSTPLGQEFDVIADNLIEGYVNSFRFGGNGNIRNLLVRDNFTDRPSSAHYLIALTGGASVFKLNIATFWANQGDYFVGVDLSQTTGTVDIIVPKIGGPLGGITHPGITVWGDSTPSRLTAVMNPPTDTTLAGGWLNRIAEPG